MLKLFNNSKLVDELYIRDVNAIKFDKVFNFDAVNGCFACISGSLILIVQVKDNKLRVQKQSVVQNTHDDTRIEHAEAVNEFYVVFSTGFAFYRLTI